VKEPLYNKLKKLKSSINNTNKKEAGKKTLLLNTATPGIQTADFTYIPEKKLIIIPTFFNNSIVAYKLNN